MSSREFVDSVGRAWRVWNTVPSARSALAAGYAEGWLTFESAKALRRLTPIPDGWEEMSVAELERLCARATTVVRRTRSFRIGERPPEGDAPPMAPG
jgi:hypothetical protein